MGMTTWEIIEEALKRRRPPRGAQWLSEQLMLQEGIKASIQAIGHWKERGVPAAKRRAIGRVLGLSLDQIDGQAPLDWDDRGAWPFPDAALLQRVKALEHDQRVEIQAKIRELVEKFESERRVSLGKLSMSISPVDVQKRRT